MTTPESHAAPSLFKGRRSIGKDRYSPLVAVIKEKWSRKGGRIEIAYAAETVSFPFESTSERADQLRNALVLGISWLKNKKIIAVADEVTVKPDSSDRDLYLDAVRKAAHNARVSAQFPKFNIHCPINNFDAYQAYEQGWYQDCSKEDFASLQLQAEQLSLVTGYEATTPAHINQLRVIQAVMETSSWTSNDDQVGPAPAP